MPVEIWLVDLYSHNHIHVSLIEPRRNEAVHRSEGFNIDIRVHAALDVYDQVAEQVRLSYLCCQISVCTDYIYFSRKESLLTLQLLYSLIIAFQLRNECET